MKHLILSSVLVAAVSLAGAAEKKKSSGSTSSADATSTARSTKSSGANSSAQRIRYTKTPVTRDESTSTQTQIITTDGKTDGTVTVTINKDGKTEVKTWKIGNSEPVKVRSSYTSSTPRQIRTTVKMEKVTWLGVAVTDISEDLASQLPLPNGVGLLVRQVTDGSPADRAGLRANDLISQLDQQLIFNVLQFRSLTRTFKAGEEVEVTYYRKGKKHTTTAKLESKEMMISPATSYPSPQWQHLRGYPDASRAWATVYEQRAKAEAQHKQAIAAANKAREAARIQSYVRSSPAKRAVIVRPDGKTTVVRTEEQIRSNIRKQVLEALKQAGVSEKILKDTLKALDQGFEEGYPKN